MMDIAPRVIRREVQFKIGESFESAMQKCVDTQFEALLLADDLNYTNKFITEMYDLDYRFVGRPLMQEIQDSLDDILRESVKWNLPAKYIVTIREND